MVFFLKSAVQQNALVFFYWDPESPHKGYQHSLYKEKDLAQEKELERFFFIDPSDFSEDSGQPIDIVHKGALYFLSEKSLKEFETLCEELKIPPHHIRRIEGKDYPDVVAAFSVSTCYMFLAIGGQSEAFGKLISL